MSSPVIPKEHLSAYQRWEMASFGDQRPSAVQTAATLDQARQQAAEEAARLHEEARQQGYAQGYAEGQAAGQKAGRTQSTAEAAKLKQIAAAFGTEVARADVAVAEDMLNLALDLAQAMLKTALKVRPELVLPIVTEAMHYLPSLQQPAVLVLHPQDAAIVREHLRDELTGMGWRIIEEAQMARGGCRIDTGSNQIDATMPMRWQRITESLGKQSDWLE